MQPLSDLKVLAFTHAAAGPYVGRLLHEWGAEVIKVEPPGGAFERESAEHHHYLSNRGKRSLAVDLKTDAGRQAIHDLVEEYDIVVQSYRPGVAERLEIDYETLREINDEVVYCSISGFGDSGPYEDRAAFDPIAQALSGVMHMTGEPDRTPSRIGAAFVDLGTATNACLAIMMAVHHRERTGEGQSIEASLFETAFAWAGMWSVFSTYHGYVPQRMGDQYETYAPSAIYETKDGEVFIAALSNSAFENVCDGLDLEHLSEDARFATSAARRENREELNAYIEAKSERFSTDALIERLLENDVAAAEVNTISDAMEDEHLQQRGMVLDIETESGTELVAPGVGMKMSAAEPRNPKRPPRVGADSVDILESVGYTPDEIRSLVENQVIEGADSTD